MENYLWRIIFIVRFLFRRINRIFPIVSYSFSTSNIPSITKIKEYLSSSIKILLGVRGLEILHRSYNVSRRFIKLSTFLSVWLLSRSRQQLFVFEGDLPWWKNHGHLSSIKCSPIGQGNFTNFHELGKPVTPPSPYSCHCSPPFCSPQGCTSVSHQYVTVQTSAPAQWGPCARSICALDGNDPTKGRSKRNHCTSKCSQFMACKKFLARSLFKPRVLCPEKQFFHCPIEKIRKYGKYIPSIFLFSLINFRRFLLWIQSILEKKNRISSSYFVCLNSYIGRSTGWWFSPISYFSSSWPLQQRRGAKTDWISPKSNTFYET